METGVAHDAAERHCRSAGHHRPRDGRPLRRLHRQRRHRCQLADHPRRHRLHQLGVYRHGCAGGTVCRRQRRGEGQPDGLPGVSDGRRLFGAARRHRLLRLADAADVGECRPGGPRRSAAVPARDVPRHVRHDDVLHAERRVPRCRRPADAASARRRDDDTDGHLQRDPDPEGRLAGRRAGDDREQHDGRVLRHLARDAAAFSDPLRAGDEPETRLHHHPVALPLRPADGRAGHRDERRRRAAAALHRIAGAERRRAGRLRRRLHGALLAHHLVVGRVDGRGGDDCRPVPRRRQPRSRGRRRSRRPRC